MSNQSDFDKRFVFIHSTYIQPEVNKRLLAGQVTGNFVVRECLIRLPREAEPIIEFNDEIGWLAKPVLAEGNETILGKPYYAHEVVRFSKVFPPKVNGSYVEYVYLFWDGYKYCLLEDRSPVHSDSDATRATFVCHDIILRHINNKIMERVVGNSKVVREKLHEIGLWIVPSLLHFPLAKIVERVGAGDPGEARRTLVEYCDASYLTERIVNTWKPINAFNSRMPFFEDALFCHKNKRYHGAISILVGQIEGVITDWSFNVNYYTTDKDRRLGEKLADFREALRNIPDLLWLYRESRDSMLRFLESEPWLQRFTLWNQQIDTSFPGRHVVQHGKYDKDIYTQENSIKLFLLLDTICQFMMFYEVRVLGRDLGQNTEEQNL